VSIRLTLKRSENAPAYFTDFIENRKTPISTEWPPELNGSQVPNYSYRYFYPAALHSGKKFLKKLF
jgi:hypothetical protein